MDKNILKQMYKPICIHGYSDEYLDGLIDVIENSCSDEPFEWYIRCIKYFLHIDEEFSEELINLIDGVDEDSSIEIIEKNRAELSVFAQAILYERILNGEDKDLALSLSLSLNTIMFGGEETLNQFHISSMKSFYREISRETIKKYRESIAKENNENNENKEDALNFLYTENKVLKWLLNLDQTRSSELNEKQFAFILGKELAERCGTQAVFNYPEAYIAKILLSSSDRKDSYSEKMPIKEIFTILNSNDEFVGCDYTLFPILSKTFKNNMDISLIDLAIEVYYEQMLFNHIKVNNYAG